jgi:hypothetical protein
MKEIANISAVENIVLKTILGIQIDGNQSNCDSARATTKLAAPCFAIFEAWETVPMVPLVFSVVLNDPDALSTTLHRNKCGFCDEQP